MDHPKNEHDFWVQRLKIINPDTLQDPFKIRVCRDRTLSITEGDEEPFNDVAIACYSVPTREEAEALVTLLGSRQYTAHPNIKLTGPWLKIDMGGVTLLEYNNLPDVVKKIQYAHGFIKKE